MSGEVICMKLAGGIVVANLATNSDGLTPIDMTLNRKPVPRAVSKNGCYCNQMKILLSDLPGQAKETVSCANIPWW